MRDGSKAGETDLDGIGVLLSIGFREILIFRSSIGSVDAGRLSLSLESSIIGECDRPISIVSLDVVGSSSICCSFGLASIFCSCFESFALSSVHVNEKRSRRKISTMYNHVHDSMINFNS